MLVKFDDNEKAYYLAPQKSKLETKYLMDQIQKSRLEMHCH